MADGSWVPAWESEWSTHESVNLALWREYVAIANAGAFDFCAAAALAERRRRREQAEAREARELRAEGGAR